MLNEPNPNVKPDIKYVKIDDTGHWAQGFLEKYGITKMVGVYIFDANEYTYCCEITPSHWLEFIETQPEPTLDMDQDTYEELCEEIREAEFNNDNDCYMHVSCVRESNSRIIEIGDMDCDDMAEAREEAQCNSL